MSKVEDHSDLELFAHIRDGDEASFEELFHRYVPQLRPVVFQIVHSEAVVKDIIQEVFFYLWLGRDKFTEIESPRNWIFRITYNRSYLYVKRQILHEKAMNHMEKEQAESFHNLTEEDVSINETTRLMQQAILQLGEQSRKIYELNRNGGFKPGEIAGQLGLSTQSVRNSLTRSGKHIRDYLKQHGIVLSLFLLLLGEK